MRRKRVIALPGTISGDLNENDRAEPVALLASDMVRYVTGAALLVDRGALENLQ